MSFKDTLHMPHTDFPMRGNLAENEPKRLAAWQAHKVYEGRLAKNDPDNPYTLPDGPPYANGDIHIGHALNKIIKDIIVRERSMQGFYTRYIPGWDTHGLPIETALTKTGKINRKAMSVADFRDACEAYALDQVTTQKAQFQRLGVLGEWDTPYLTLQHQYEASQLDIFASMVEKGLIYKGLKPVLWSPSSETALAEAEIEYHEKRSPSVYVKMTAVDAAPFERPYHFLIWTTTPWTIPANLAIAVDETFTYALVDYHGEAVVVADALIPALETVFETSLPVLKKVKGQALLGATYRHPLYDRISPVVAGHHVTLESGTGLVHIAPGHGEDDFIIGQKYGLEVLCPVDGEGKMTEEAGPYEGLFVEDASKKISEDLAASKHLVKLVFIHHPYPHDWRTQKPVIFRATRQWFASIESLKGEMIEAIHAVTWIPSWGETRMENMVKDRASWCISRQRSWGVPIPVFYAEDDTAILDPVVIRHVSQLFKAHGSNIWFEWPAHDLLPAGFTHPHSPGNEFTKETDILDVWFDSGTSHKGGMTDFGLAYPADVYVEGSDQYRGWFNSSLSTGLAYTGQAPYKAVLTHGFVLDGDGLKMSKSKGNAVDPNKVMAQKGADILRLWVASVDYQSDVRISDAMLSQVTETYRKIRNTLRFMLGTLHDFNPQTDQKQTSDLTDQFIRLRLSTVVNEAIKAYDSFAFSDVVRTVNQFLNRDLSAFYLDLAKDMLYIERQNDPRRRAMQTVIYHALDHIMRLMTPILPFTMEEVYDHFGHREEASVYHLNIVPYPTDSDPALTATFERLLAIRDDVLKALEMARNDKVIGKSLEAHVTLTLPEEDLATMTQVGRLEKFFIVSEVTLKEGRQDVKVAAHAAEKCERCWHHAPLNEDHLCDRCRHVLEDVHGE